MKLSVIGCGYLGAVHAACMAQLGHEVVGIDTDPNKIALLQRAETPFFEPGLGEVLEEATVSGRLTFSTEIADAAGASVHFIAVGTPQRAGSDAADLTYVDSAVDALIPFLSAGDVVVGKSTVPVGTAERLAAKIAPTGALLVWNPEFLREGFAVKDTIEPDRIVYGLPAGEAGTVAQAALDGVYRAALDRETPLVVTDYATAELVKVSANAFLATKISFINAMAEIADTVGADVTELADAIGFDARIGRRFLNAGVGFGGGCLPKDIRAFRARGEELGLADSVSFLRTVDEINLRQRERVVDIATEQLGGDVTGKRIAVLGLTFKPNSDDIRDSPAIDVARRLQENGARVIATDPEGRANTSRVYPDLVTNDLETALTDAEIVVLLTEWSDYRELDPAAVATLTAGKTVVDGRNALDRDVWAAAGWKYIGLGRR